MKMEMMEKNLEVFLLGQKYVFSEKSPRAKFWFIYIRGPKKVFKMAKNENVQWSGLFPILFQFGCLVSEGNPETKANWAFGKRRAGKRKPRNVLKIPLRAFFKTFVSNWSRLEKLKIYFFPFFFFFKLKIAIFGLFPMLS